MPNEYSVPSIDRALAVLELLAQSRGGFSVSEISRKLTLPKSSVHLLIGTLERRGYLQKNALSGKYCFGLKLVSLSRTALENLDLREEAKPSLQALMRKTGLTVHMAVLERNEAVIVEKIECPGLLRLATWIGRRLDVNCTGVGKALIAFLADEEFDRQFKTKALARHNENTMVSTSKLKQELERVRRLGYSLDDEEDEIGFRCIGAPLFNYTKKAVAAISVAGTTAQIPDGEIAQLAGIVKHTAAAISSQLSYIQGDS
ncbi:MAG: IclR family transcriptional regulator [Bryobacteraceae bacterium]